MPAQSRPARYDLHLHTCWSYDATASAGSHIGEDAWLDELCERL